MFTEEFEAGRSVRGQAIRAVRMGNGPEVTVFLGAHHGDEKHGKTVLERLLQLLDSEPERLSGRTVIFVPVLNPDGFAADTRHNANGVDLNRNLPTRDWSAQPTGDNYPPGPAAASEPETQALAALVERWAPVKIVTIHAPLGCLNWNGLSEAEVSALSEVSPRRYREDGRTVVCAEALGKAMAAENGYPCLGDIGYPCPGSFGTWAGHERHIATITLEVGRDINDEQAWEENRGALLAALAF